MDYDGLSHFIRKRMQMTHVYQPIMIRTLLESADNTATADDIARDIVDVEPTLLEYYRGRVKVWPHKTLLKHGIVSYKRGGGGAYRLVLDDTVTKGQIRRLAGMCSLRLREFIDEGPAIRHMRALNDGPIPGSMRHDVLARSGGVCVGCGVRSSGARLHVDHIIPRSRNGRTVLENLQALCAPCNQAKRDRDGADFVKWQKRLRYRHPGCSLCVSDPEHPPVVDNGIARAVRSGHADAGFTAESMGSILVHPKRHVGTLLDMIPAERSMCVGLIDSVVAGLEPGGGRASGASGPTVLFDSQAVVGAASHYSIRIAVPRT